MDYVRRWGVRRARAVAQLAIDAGHDVSLHHREPPPEHPKGNHKWWATCTCGWNSVKWFAQQGATIAAINHLAREAAEEDHRRKSLENGGVPSGKSDPRSTVAPIGVAKEVGA